jgi:signal-transduction protein with cAMP-binding, CBS, and nucleotidyltransferase domain
MTESAAVSQSARVIAAVPTFAGLDAATLAAVARTVTRQQYVADQVVFLEGDPSAGLYVVERGWLKAVKVAPSGREQTLRVVGPGEVFSDLSVLAGAPNPATVIALEASISASEPTRATGESCVNNMLKVLLREAVVERGMRQKDKTGGEHEKPEPLKA